MIYLFLSFVFLIIILLFLFVVGLPLLVKINAEFHNAGEYILQITPNINNEEANQAVQQARNALPQNQQILSFFIQYSWIIIILIIVVVLFIFARRSVEYPAT